MKVTIEIPESHNKIICFQLIGTNNYGGTNVFSNTADLSQGTVFKVHEMDDSNKTFCEQFKE